MAAFRKFARPGLAPGPRFTRVGHGVRLFIESRPAHEGVKDMNTVNSTCSAEAEEATDRALSRKASALRLLGPLGFIDNNDAEVLGAIWHPVTGLVLDASSISPAEVVRVIYEAGEAAGREALQRELALLLGLK